MSGLTRGGSLGVYYTVDDEEPIAAEKEEVDDRRVNVITGTKAPEPAPLNPGPAKAVREANMDYTGFALGGVALVALYFLMK